MSRIGVVVAAVALAFAGGVGGAAAHEGEESERAADLVLQAIAVIANTPDDVAAVREKVTDALEAGDPAGVDLALVREADAALGRGRIHEGRSLLERAIGAQPHQVREEPPEIRETSKPEPADDREPAAAVPGDALAGRRGFPGSDWAILLASVVVVALGVRLTIRYRPRHGEPA